jgi:hypothetical protein
MKKTSKRTPSRPRRPESESDEILPEYDFSQSRPNPYAARLVAGGHLVVIEPDVAEVFPDAAAVNDALRVLARLQQPARRRTPAVPKRRRTSRRRSA